MKQTSVEWLIQQIKRKNYAQLINNPNYELKISIKDLKRIGKQAMDKHKNEIVNAWDLGRRDIDWEADGEEYYQMKFDKYPNIYLDDAIIVKNTTDEIKEFSLFGKNEKGIVIDTLKKSYDEFLWKKYNMPCLMEKMTIFCKEFSGDISKNKFKNHIITNKDAYGEDEKTKIIPTKIRVINNWLIGEVKRDFRFEGDTTIKSKILPKSYMIYYFYEKK